MTTATSPTTSARWQPFVAGVLAFFLVMSGPTVMTPLFPVYAETFGFTPFDITVIFAVYAAGVIGALLGAGPWSDEIGRRPMLLGGLVLSALGSLILCFGATYWVFLAARLVQGLSVGIFTASATVAVQEMAPPQAGKSVGLGATVANMGGLGAGPILGGAVALMAANDLQTPWLVHLILSLAVLALLWTVPEPGTPKRNPRLHGQGLSVPSEVRAIFVPAAIAAVAGFMICGFLTSIAPAFLGQVMGFEGRFLLIGTVAGGVFLASCVGQVIEEWVPARRVLPLGTALLAAGATVLTAGFWTASLWVLGAGIVLSGIGHGFAFRGGLMAIGARAPADQAAEVTASYFVVGYLSISLPVLICGALQAVLPLHAIATGYAAVAAALAALACALILRRDRDPG